MKKILLILFAACKQELDTVSIKYKVTKNIKFFLT